MQFLTTFVPPSDAEMFERDFFFSLEHDPNEAVVSFARTYADDRSLKLTFDIGVVSSVSALVIESGRIVSSLTIEGVTNFAFQSWHGESIIRFAFSAASVQQDLRVHYFPRPSMHFTALAKDV